MASLRYSQIRGSPGGTVHYIANKDKVICEEVHDVGVVLNYMGEPESTERVFSFARHCSQNPDLAEKQMDLHRQMYFASKKGGVQGLKKGKSELLGLHFFLSYTVADNPSEQAMTRIAMKLAEHPKFKDFAVFGAHHFDREHRHTHFFVSAYSADGKPRKLAMKREAYNEIRRYANKLCVEEGLSIIDLSGLRYNNKEYSDWVDGVISEGKIVVHSERESHKRNPKQTISTRDLYYKWHRNGEEKAEEDIKIMSDARREKKNFEEKFFYTTDGNDTSRWFVSLHPNKYYVVPWKDGDRRRSRLECTLRFVVVVAKNEGEYVQKTAPALWPKFHAKVDSQLQGMMDCIATSREMNIKNPEEVASKLADVGRQMNALKKEKKRHEESIAKQEKILEAYDSYARILPLMGDGTKLPSALQEEFDTAYAVLASNRITSVDRYEEVRRRYQFERQKVCDYDRRMPELNRQYRQLKKMEAITANPTAFLESIYDYSVKADEVREAIRRGESIDDLIGDASARASGTIKNDDNAKIIC